LLNLTEEGKALAARVVPAHEEFLQQQMQHLSAEEQRTLYSLLRDLDRSLA
jgi:DNA-binding MarR family transcriptional regulator